MKCACVRRILISIIVSSRPLFTHFDATDIFVNQKSQKYFSSFCYQRKHDSFQYLMYYPHNKLCEVLFGPSNITDICETERSRMGAKQAMNVNNELLAKLERCTMYVSRRRVLSIEVFKTLKHLNPSLFQNKIFYRVSQKNRPAFERLLLPEYISNDILQYLTK